MTESAKKMIQEELEEMKQKLKQAGSEASGAMKQAVENAAYNLSFLENAHAVHNIYYAAQILRKTDAALSEAAQKAGITLPDLSDRPLMSGGFCAVMCHQKVGVKVPPEYVKFEGKNMPHLAHTRMISCVKCHEFGSHKNVQIRFKKEDCKVCHEF